MKRKRIASALLAMAMVLSLVTVPAFAEEPEAGNWYDEAMTTWADYGIIKGDANGDLLPEAQITRGELAVILDRLMDYQVTGKNTFTDVVVGEWYASAILAANAAGIVKGDGTTARPLDKITREEAAVMFARVLSLSGEGGASAGYTDEAQISSWAVDAVKSMTAKGYMKGSDGALRPKDPITRAEVMTILSNVFQAYYHEAGTYTEDVAGTAVVSVGGVTLKDMKVSGDLILAEGVADGTINLDGVTVTGKLIVRGGGEHSIIIKGRSVIGEVIVARQEGKVRVSVQGNAKVDVVVIDDGSDAVKVEGAVETLTIEGPGSKVEITGDVKNVTMSENAAGATLDVGKDAKVTTLTTAAEGAAVAVAGTVTNVNVSEGAKDATLDVAKTAKVQNLTTAAEGAKVAVAGTVTNVTVAEGAKDTTLEVAKGAAVSKVETAGDGTAITGDGAVKNVTVTGGEGTKIETPGTKVENKSESPVIVGDKEIASGETGKADGTVPSTGGGGSSSGGSSTTYADVVTAPLHDTRTGEGKFVPDNKLYTTYTVTGGAESTSEGVTTASVTINATHVMKHQNAANAMGYWVGFGMPKVDGNKYYVTTDLANLGSEVTTVPGRTHTVNGKDYNTIYFSHDTAAEYTPVYVVVQNDGKTTKVYNVTFNVTLAAPIENMRVFLVNDEASYKTLPASYLANNPWNEGHTVGFPWLVVTYDRNVAEAINFTVTHDGGSVTATPNQATAATIGTERYMMWEFADRKTGADHLGLTNESYGLFRVTATAATSGGAQSGEVLFQEPGKTYYTVSFDSQGGSTVAPVENVVEGGTLGARMPANPTRTGYTFGGWYAQANGEGTVFKADTAVDGNITVYAKWTAITSTVTFNYDGATGGNSSATAEVTYDDTYATLPTPTKTGYTFDGWYTAQDGGTKVENTTKVTATANHTLYAQWTLNKVGALTATASAHWTGTEDNANGVTGTVGSIVLDGNKELNLTAKVELTQADMATKNGEFPIYVELDLTDKDFIFDSIERVTVLADGTELPDEVNFGSDKIYGQEGRYAIQDDSMFMKFGKSYAKQGITGAWYQSLTGDITDTITFKQGEEVVATATYTLATSNIKLEATAEATAADWVTKTSANIITGATVKVSADRVEIALAATDVLWGVAPETAEDFPTTAEHNAAVKTALEAGFTTLGIKLPNSFTAETSYTMIQTNEGLKAYPNDSGIEEANGVWTRTSTRTGAVLNVSDYFYSFVAMDGKDVTLEIKDGEDTVLTYVITNTMVYSETEATYDAE